MSVGKKVESLRRQKGMSQKELAKLIGKSQNTIYKIEADVTQKSAYLPEIAKALGTTLDELLNSSPVEESSISPERARLIRKIESAQQGSLKELESVIDAVLKVHETKSVE